MNNRANADDVGSENSRGLLDDSTAVNTSAIGVLGGTAQVEVPMTINNDDDEFVDDEVASPGAAVAAPGRPAARQPAEVVQKSPAEPARLAPTTEVELTSKRLGDFADSARESADLLTSDRLLDPAQRVKPEPEGTWPRFVYAASAHLINLGDSRKVRARKQLSSRIATPIPGGARFIAVLSRKGGVGKTTVTTLLGMAMADAREDRVVAIDANPDRGTLADRITHRSAKSVRDLAQLQGEIHGYQDISSIVSRDATRLDVLASDADPHIAEAFSDVDYRNVAEVAAQYYSIVLTDTGTGIVHAAMRETLAMADQVVVVTGLSVDEARLASETLTWLENNGHEDLAREAVVVVNTTAPGKTPVREEEIRRHFDSRVNQVVHLPYDAHIAGGGEIVFADLPRATREAARELAARVVENMRARAK